MFWPPNRGLQVPKCKVSASDWGTWRMRLLDPFQASWLGFLPSWWIMRQKTKRTTDVSKGSLSVVQSWKWSLGKNRVVWFLPVIINEMSIPFQPVEADLGVALQACQGQYLWASPAPTARCAASGSRRRAKPSIECSICTGFVAFLKYELQRQWDIVVLSTVFVVLLCINEY